MTKEIILPTVANKGLFYLGPLMTIMPALVAWVVIPFGPDIALSNINAGLLLLMAITSIEVYGVIIAGWASNSKYALPGRAARLGPDGELRDRDGLRLVVVLMVAGSMNMTDIVMSQAQRLRRQPRARHVLRGTGCRCCRSSSCTSSPAWPRPTAIRSTWSRANPRSSPAT